MAEYPNFAALSAAENEDKDFRVRIEDRKGSPIVIVAPHGGGIEPGTYKSPRRLRDATCHLLILPGSSRRATEFFTLPARTLTSRVVQRWLKRPTTCSDHGEESEEPVVYLGGKDSESGGRVRKALATAGFTVKEHPNRQLQGLAKRNICNRNRSGAGSSLSSAGSPRKVFSILERC